jgi:hypothetical protein
MRSAAIILALAIAADAAAEPVSVRVVEVAGGVAYVTPGRASGLVAGTKVHIRDRALVVIESTEKTAVLRLEGGVVAVGDSGTANVDRTAAAAVTVLAKPRPPQAFVGQWPEAVRPAETQNPTPVSLGASRAPGEVHVTVIGHGYGTVAKDSHSGSGGGRVIATLDILNDRPLAADVDVAGRVFSGGYDSHTHTPLFVRAAQLRYGSAMDPTIALGRLRFAASSVGMLDGGRAAAHVGSFELAAFGGLVPDPVSGRPETSASRFGTELTYGDDEAAWQPRVAVVAYGSTWEGDLDERRLSVVASANRASAWIDGWAEAQQFPSGNPWNASAVELTGAGGAFEYRQRGTHAGVDVAFLRPERSLRLAAVLPPEWLCTLAPRPGVMPETCAGGDFWVSATASAGLRSARFALDAASTIGDSHGAYSGYDSSGYLRGELRAGTMRVIAGASGGHASFATWMAAEAGVGASLSRRLDASVTYRPELLDYRASTGSYLLHSIVMDAHYTLSPELDVAGSAAGTAGSDRNALAMLATFIWRPLP